MPDAASDVDETPELPSRQRIHAAGRLVEKDDRRFVQDRAAEREPLPPAARQVARRAGARAREAGHVEHERAAIGERGSLDSP